MENRQILTKSLQQKIIFNSITSFKGYSIYIVNQNGIIETWNNGAQNSFGYESDEIIGRNHQLFYPQEKVLEHTHVQLLRTAAATGNSNYEGYFVRKDGSRFWGTAIIDLYSDPENNQNYFLNVIADLSSQKLAEDNYANTIEKLHTANLELKRNEDKFHGMISEIRDYAIILLDTQGNILEWNKGAEQLKGYTAEEITGNNFRLFYTREDKESKLPEILLTEARDKGVANHEGFRLRKNGTRFWAGVTITAIRDHSGQITGYAKVTRDLTSRKNTDDQLARNTSELQQKNEELRQSEERYHKMISEVQDYAILLLSIEGRIQNWNSGAEFIKGYKYDEIINKDFRIFYTPDDIASKLPDKLLSEAEEKGKATNEGWRVKKDGTKFWAYVVITALHNDKGEVIGYSKVTRDLTEKKAAEDAMKRNAQDLQLKNLQLEKLNKELSSFAYVVSHDFKEPIRKIQTFAGRQLEDDKSIDQIREFSNKISSSALRMRRLMDSLLSYSTMSSNENGLEQVDLNQILEAVKIDLEILINSSNASIHSDPLPVIKGISFQLHQMFLNLLSNSLKFTRKNILPEIIIKSNPVSYEDLPQAIINRDNPFCLLTFSDNGIGFDPDQSNKIFDVFQRLHSDEFFKGTGIGLSIVKKVVENHNGFIEAEGEPDCGATFRIYLPLPGFSAQTEPSFPALN